jgi:hypothetical protein
MSSPRPGLVPSFRAKNNPMDEPQVTPLSELGPQCEAQRERIRKLFESGAGARETLRQLCELADATIKKVFGELLRVRSTPPQGLALLALGGYGREMLFPYSDLDLLFLFGTENPKKSFAPDFRVFAHAVGSWLRVSSAGRTLDECRHIEESTRISPGYAGSPLSGRRCATLRKIGYQGLAGSGKTDPAAAACGTPTPYP